MSRLAMMAEAHYGEWLPRQYAQIKDKLAFFADLEEQALDRIDLEAEALRGPTPEGETYLARLGRRFFGRVW